jgi:hypothetical protein
VFFDHQAVIPVEGEIGQEIRQMTMEVENQAQAALQTSPIFALRDLHVERNGESLLISGRVSSFYYKQLAQEVVRSVSEGLQVVNSIDVEYRQPK